MVLTRCKLYSPTVPALAEPSPLLPFQDAVESPSSSCPQSHVPRNCKGSFRPLDAVESPSSSSLQSQVPRNYKDVFRPPSFLLLFLYLSHPAGIWLPVISSVHSKPIIPGEWFLGKPWSSLCLLFINTNWIHFK